MATKPPLWDGPPRIVACSNIWTNTDEPPHRAKHHPYHGGRMRTMLHDYLSSSSTLTNCVSVPQKLDAVGPLSARPGTNGTITCERRLHAHLTPQPHRLNLGISYKLEEGTHEQSRRNMKHARTCLYGLFTDSCHNCADLPCLAQFVLPQRPGVVQR